MKLVHVGLASSSEARADRFYAGLLGLEKRGPKMLPSGIAHALFGVDREMAIVDYRGEASHFEVIIHEATCIPHGAIPHACIEIDDVHALVKKCRSLDLEVVQVPKGDKTITFVADHDGNRFEVTARPAEAAP